jgi:hypothetical protein
VVPCTDYTRNSTFVVVQNKLVTLSTLTLILS